MAKQKSKTVAPEPVNEQATSVTKDAEAEGHHAEPLEFGENFNRARRPDNHIAQCGTGYRKPEYSQIHHLLCVHSCSDGTMPKGTLVRNRIKKVLAKVKWDIDESSNTIGLPTKSAYYGHRIGEKSKSQKGKNKATGDESEDQSPGWDMFPCHMVDHNPRYTTGVSNWVHQNIWIAMLGGIDRKKCKITNPKKVRKLFDAGSDFFRNQLKVRGERSGGTASIIAQEFAHDAWCHPFSMAHDPKERSRPPRKDVQGKIDEVLMKAIF